MSQSAPPETIREGAVVFADGSSAILGDVTRVTEDPNYVHVSWRTTMTVEDIDDLTVVSNPPPKPIHLELDEDQLTTLRALVDPTASDASIERGIAGTREILQNAGLL
jgi:hypothetical protein